ncbi:hypothetical protein [Arthrobacter dokdonensis]|uniref:hypothetical protein n=1 Tax=Arthrobacter dokdonellae TaxID=2211210 RepID=UPI001013CC4A|nr:hypothetical protein [Arthrobacter dokdonellae]
MTKKIHCPHCQATRQINRYDNGTVYSIRIQHQDECPTRTAAWHKRVPVQDTHASGPGQADD